MPETKTKEATADKSAVAGKADKADNDVLKTLRAAAKGLLFPSESDKPVKAFLWDGGGSGSGTGAVDAAAFTAAGKIAAGAAVETVTVEKFFDPVITPESWWGDEEKATAKQYQDLTAALQANLSDITVFRVAAGGEDGSLVDAYVVGRTADGHFAGVQTQLVET
jgi:hypothetical protein